jgi:hypothetical protein
MRRGTGQSLGILPLALTPLRLRSGSFGLGQDDRVKRSPPNICFLQSRLALLSDSVRLTGFRRSGKDDSIERVACFQPRNYLLLESVNANIRRLFTVFYGHRPMDANIGKSGDGKAQTLPQMNTDEVRTCANYGQTTGGGTAGWLASSNMLGFNLRNFVTTTA